MSDKYDQILKKTLENERVLKKVNSLNLTKDQMLEALPILIDMSEEKDDENVRTLTSFEVHENGSIKRTSILSSKGIRLRYLENIVTNKINPINFEDNKKFINDENRKKVVNLFARYLKSGNHPKKGIYLFGNMGIGKTFIMKKIAKRFAEAGEEVGFINLTKLVSILKGTFGTDNEEYLEILNLLSKVKYLFIDDIGAEKITTWFRDDFLFNLLNERMEHKKITFFSSNYSQEKLSKKQSLTSGSSYRDYDNANRLVSRVQALSIEVFLDGKNRR